VSGQELWPQHTYTTPPAPSPLGPETPVSPLGPGRPVNSLGPTSPSFL